MNNKIYQVAVIGCGARGETFARQLHRGHPRAELFGVCDVDGDRLQKFCGYCELDGAVQFTDVAELLSRPELDAVIITTPEFTHAEVAIAALQAGKHIYLEKAMAESSAACRRIVETHQKSSAIAFVGFNMRAVNVFEKLKSVVDSGVLGQIVHISGLEQLQVAHGAAFMRRYHRHSARSGGLLNTKCAHDLDLLQWLIGHQHKVARVASFGGSNVFTPDKQPAKYCHACPIQTTCPYADRAGFVFPVLGHQPIHHQRTDVYGGDLCVYDPDKDLVDNQAVIFEWENGVRGNFELQMFQSVGRRRVCIWGEEGYVEANTYPEPLIRVTASATGDTTEYTFERAEGGHGGSDVRMLDLFVNAIESNDANDSGLGAGLAATLLAESADIARKSGQIVAISPDAYL